MANTLIDTVIQFQDRSCTRRYCGKCSLKFRAMLEDLPDLERELETLDVHQIPRGEDWETIICWAFRSLPSQAQRDRVLTAWTRHLEDDLDFVDSVVYYVIDVEDDCKGRAGREFLESVVKAAIRTGDVSLTETLVWRLGTEVAQLPALLDQAKKLGETNELVYKALVAAKFCRSKQELEARARRSKKLFRAIERDDIACVRAVLKKGVDLTAANENGQTAAEYATSLGKSAIRSSIDS